MRILTIQPSPQHPPELLGNWLTDSGANPNIILPAETALPTEMVEYQAVVVLDGPIGPLDDLQHPWLAQARSLLSQAISRNSPILGLSFGAQLLAVSTGGQVRASRNGPEVGPSIVAKRDIATQDPLMNFVPLTPDVLQFHTDEIDVLPAGAQLLASSPRCENQAFRIGACGYGFQFHIGTTPARVVEWSRERPELTDFARPDSLEPEYLEAFHADLAETWQPVVQRFVRLAGQAPEERGLERSLPLA